MRNKKNKDILCPFCRKPVLMQLFNGNETLKRVRQKARNAARKEREEKKTESNVSLSVAGVQRLLQNEREKQLEWMIVQNEIPAACRDWLLLVEHLLTQLGVQPPENYYGEAKCHVVNDLWFWCFREVYRSKTGAKKMPPIRVQHNENTDRFELIFNIDALADEQYLLASVLRPVCPHCRRILPDSFPIITDDPIYIHLLGDPSVGKTVWQTALMSYLKRMGRLYLGSRSEYIELMNGIDTRLENRMAAFCNGLLPSQTAREAIRSDALRGDPVQFTDFYQDGAAFAHSVFESPFVQNEQSRETRALTLLLMYSKTEKVGNRTVQHRRFVSVQDCAGENAAGHVQGINSADELRFSDAFFFFVDLCSKSTGERSVEDYVADTMSLRRPYFAMLIPKADRPEFPELLLQSLTQQYIKVFAQVLAFNLTAPGETLREEALQSLCSLFAQQYLHHSPEALAGFLCNRFDALLNESCLISEQEQTAEALFELLTGCEEVQNAFAPQDARAWLNTTIEKALFTHGFPADGILTEEPEREMLRQYFMRYILDSCNVDMEKAGRHSSDVSVFAVSSLGTAPSEIENMQTFRYDEWDPINLALPLLRFLTQYNR